MREAPWTGSLCGGRDGALLQAWPARSVPDFTSPAVRLGCTLRAGQGRSGNRVCSCPRLLCDRAAGFCRPFPARLLNLVISCGRF